MKSSDLFVDAAVRYNGKVARVAAISKRTGAITIELREKLPPYKAYDKLVVMPYDLEDYYP